jgi:hypothetical protein
MNKGTSGNSTGVSEAPVILLFPSLMIKEPVPKLG